MNYKNIKLHRTNLSPGKKKQFLTIGPKQTDYGRQLPFSVGCIRGSRPDLGNAEEIMPKGAVQQKSVIEIAKILTDD